MRSTGMVVRGLLTALMVLGLAACADQMDMTRFGGGGNASNGPQPDSRGVITYPTYQVAVSQPGDTVRIIANRLGQDPDQMASLNGIHPDTALRTGEIVVLPTRIESLGGQNGQADITLNGQPGAAPGFQPVGPNGQVRQPGAVDIQSIAGAAIDNATQPGAAPRGSEPLRYVVRPGETAEGIAARFGVNLQELMQLNRLRSNTSLRVGQILLIPTRPKAAPPQVTPEPGHKITSVAPPPVRPSVPPPPSAATPLPKNEPAASALPTPKLNIPDASAPPAAAPPDTKGTLTLPVKGTIIRDYQKGKSDGIDISAPAGSPVVAAADGTVAAITRDTKGVPILVIRHAGGLLTVYAGIDNLTVSRGDTVTRGQKIAVVRAGNPPFLHFETRKGIESIDPSDYL